MKSFASKCLMGVSKGVWWFMEKQNIWNLYPVYDWCRITASRLSRETTKDGWEDY